MERALSDPAPSPAAERPRMDVDIACVGFGPAMAGFLNTLAPQILNPDGTPAVESPAAPGVPPQILCYERADDIAFGVSGVVTRARAIRETFPGLPKQDIPMAAPVAAEKVLYLLDPHGASRRSPVLAAGDAMLRAFQWLLPVRDQALELPWTPAFLHKSGGMIFSMGQFMQWAGAQAQALGTVQIWPGTPVAQAILHDDRVAGIRLMDQGVDKSGNPTAEFTPGMDIHAALTVVGDGPVGAVGRQLDETFGMPEGHHARDWAVGMKFVVDLPANSGLACGTVLHTFGYPEPEIFGFLYVHPNNTASLGIFVPSWFDSPARTAYRYLQHWMLHPRLWRHLKGGKLRSWGAKSIAESGRRGEPRLAGNGYARIGEGSGSTNVLTNSGVDEAWATGAQLAQAVIELLKDKKPFTRGNLESTYVARRRASWVESEGRIAERARDGFQNGILPGMIGMVLAAFSNGRLHLGREPVPPWKRVRRLDDYYRGVIPPEEVRRIRDECAAKAQPLHDALMDRAGWPAIPFDGQLLVSHQDALLLGGKVQAPPGCADHVAFLYPALCESCGTKICVELCSGQAIAPGKNGGVPSFDREKCVFCGACVWNCARPLPDNPEQMNIAFHAGAGGLHSAEN